MNRDISLVLVGDGATPETGVASRIRAQPGFHVVASLTDIAAVLEQVCRSRPDIVLLNLQQTGDDTQTLAGALHGSAPGSRVILMGLEAPQKDVARFLRAGVAGFIMAGASFDDFLTTIHSVVDGIPVLPPDLTCSLFGQLRRYGVLGRPKRVPDVMRLTARERQVAGLIVEGMTNRAIATRLQIALHTVKTHVHRVLAKLEVNSRIEIAAFSTALLPDASM